MTTPARDALGDQVRGFCARIGADRLLVQGAGGNVSWKSGGRLWIKASGAWLADARSREIFVAVDQQRLAASLARGDFQSEPAVLEGTGLRPSIETTLHALLPHRVVVHVHAVEALAHLVRPDGRQAIEARLDKTIRSAYVPYRRPGPELASAIQAVQPAAIDAVFLGSHGLVLGADTVEAVQRLLDRLVSALATPPARGSVFAADGALPAIDGYRPCADDALHALARSPELLRHVERHWALYPDHVVFLGAAPILLDDDGGGSEGAGAPFLFVRGRGVLQAAHAQAGHLAQLRCYLDVLERQSPSGELVVLTAAEVDELVSWDAEKHRQALSTGDAARP